MPRITPGNRLYIYQLLSREIGTGKQTLLAKVEEVFAADDLLPEDLGCSSVQEVLEELGDMVKLTVFKRGNTYATLLQNDEWDHALQQPDEPSPAKKAAAKGKPWKHRSKTKVVRPTKPRHRKVEAAPAEAITPIEPEPVPEPAAPTEPAATPKPLAEATLATEEPGSTPSDTNDAEAETQPVETAPEPAPDVMTAEVPQDASSDEPSTSRASIRLTVTFDPSETEGPTDSVQPEADQPEEELPQGKASLGQQSAEASAKPSEAPLPQEPTPTPAARPQEPMVQVVSPTEEQPVAVEPILVGLPDDFVSQVHVPDGPLSLLYQLVPPDTNPMGLLSEDWDTARSTRSYGGTRGLVTFPLRLMRADSVPVRATIHRSAKAIAGKHWTLTRIDGSDGSDLAAGDADLEGLRPLDNAAERMLTHEVELGPWPPVLEALAHVAAPEPWDLPDGPGEHAILRTYLAATYRAAVRQGLVAHEPEGHRAAFDTGLLSPLSEHVYACLEGEGTEATAPWRLLGFSTTGEGTLGEHLASLGTLPQAPRYLRGVADLDLSDVTIDVPKRLRRSLGPDGREILDAALRWCVADYRLPAPAVDVETGEACLLIPLALKDAVTPDRALALRRKPDGTVGVFRLLDLATAYVEARIVSRGMPAWLVPPTKA